MRSFQVRTNDDSFYFRCIVLVVLPLMLWGCHSETAATEEAQKAVKSIATDALSAWQQSDWASMYETLSSVDKELQTDQEFRQKRELLNKAQQLKGFRVVEVFRSGYGKFVVKVELEFEEDYNSGFRSSLDPRMTEMNVTWTVVRERGLYRITFVAEDSPTGK